jgi:hypothetical protein
MRKYLKIINSYYIIVMSKTISMVDLNSDSVAAAPDAPAETLDEIKEESPAAEAVDIDTDELESLLTDLKATKKRNKMPPKKRERKPKVVAPVEAEPVVEVSFVEEPEVAVEPPQADVAVQAEAKTKRKYVRKPQPAAAAVEPPTPQHSTAEEPSKRTAGSMIEEMQRAERALRYQMRKNKMQSLVTQAF